MRGQYAMGVGRQQLRHQAGSWVRDQCCHQNPGVGRYCDGPKTTFSQVCSAETDKAGHRLAHRLSWKRRLDTCKASEDGPTPGIVIHGDYCAPAGTIIVHEREASLPGG